MTDDEDSEEPAVTLGTERTVEGAPLARVTARLMWGIEQSAVREREGDTVIRTPEGPRELGELLDDVDQQYFATRQEFEAALGEVIGDGPVPTESDEQAVESAENEDDEPAGDEDTEPAEDAGEDGGEQTDGETDAEDSATAEGTPESTTEDDTPADEENE